MDKEAVKNYLFNKRGEWIYLKNNTQDEEKAMIEFCYKHDLIMYQGKNTYRVNKRGLDLITGDLDYLDLLSKDLNFSNPAPINTHNTQANKPFKSVLWRITKKGAEFIFYVLVGVAIWYFTILHPIIK